MSSVLHILLKIIPRHFNAFGIGQRPRVSKLQFLSVLHRLFAPGSDRAAEKWKLDYAIGGTEGLELHQLYRTMAWLGEPLQVANDAHPVSLRTRKDRIEEALFDRRRDLFTQLALVFFDHTAVNIR